MTNLDSHFSTENGNNHELELKYPRKVYEAIIESNGFEKFENIHDRLRELSRCLGIENPLAIQPIMEHNKIEKNKMKIEVDNYYDYMKLIGPWPVNSFNTGVMARPTPPKLVVNIINVDKAIVIDRDDKKIKEMEDIYGLINVERITTKENEPTNKLKANVRSINDFIKCIKQGIYISLTSKKHKVTPSIIHSKVCNNCGSINHKICKMNKRCLRCGDYDHDRESCKKWPKCINCGGKHSCNSNDCEKLNEKTLLINAYAISILEGEGIIENKNRVLRTNRSNSNNDEVVATINDNNLDEIVKHILQRELDTERTRVIELENKMNKYITESETKFVNLDSAVSKLGDHVIDLDAKVTDIDSKIKSVDTKIGNIEKKAILLENKITEIDGKVTSVEEKTQKLKIKIGDLLKKADSNHSEALKKQDENFQGLKALIQNLSSNMTQSTTY
ncbi:unnamed protein product [Brachionus calyciflorus]|uniref:Uncharacterized protein n=1 Tax=Brachionus calyciflorus TaxID=104777 RepID=A0A813V0K1_9BILA|nr:unnamed protein product [Brachionus calyciflorus]